MIRQLADRILAHFGYERKQRTVDVQIDGRQVLRLVDGARARYER